MVELRSELEQSTGFDLSALHPTDDLAVVFDYFDFADLVYGMEVSFGVLKEQEFSAEGVDSTFDALARHIHGKRMALCHSHT